MAEYNEIDCKDFDLGETVRVHLGLKTLEGRMFLDVRKHFKFPNLDQFVSSKKGIMLDLNAWKLILPKIQEYINENSKD